MTPAERAAYDSLIDQRDALISRIWQTEKEHYERFEIPRPADEPHDSGCQRHPDRFGDLKGVACTCESNRVRRQEAIRAAGAAGDTIVRSSLGSYEQMRWDEGARQKP